MDSPKHKSRKEVSEKESKRSHRDRDKDDREHNRERNGLEKHHHRSSADKKSKDSSHHSVRDSREDRHKRKEVEGEREHKERGHKEKERSKSRVDERVRDRDDREAERDKDDKDRHREKVREKEREHEDKERECGVKEHERERERERKEKEKEKEKEREREDKEREKERERKEKEREREDKEREKERERKEKERERENKERERERERERKEKEREREDKERERERERKERAREKEREREDKERERERERKERERERERARREREKEEERAREKEVDRIREKEKRRATSRDYSSDDSDVKGHEKKRRRREDDHKTRDSEKGSKNNKHRDKNEDGDPQKTTEDEPVGRKETTWEEDMAEEQKKLDEEMEKRRRRVQEWQELKRKREEHEMEKHGVASSAEEPNSGKAWTLEGDSDDEEPASGGGEDSHMDVDGVAMSIGENGDAMAVDTETEPVLTMSQTMDEGTVGAEDIDPLDAFMNSVVLPEVEKLNDVSVPSSVDTMSNFKEKNGKNQERPKKGSSKSFGRIISGEDSDSDYGDVDNEEDPLEDEDDEEFLKRVKKTKVEKLTIVDHSKIDYPPFRKNFHIEVKEIARMTSEEVSAWRKQLELKIHGKDVPKPVKAWHQTGLSTKILETIKKCNFERPMPIQAQALPVIMSGRDCIGIAKTGSGKTLAFVLPMLRHIKDQPPLMSGDGPIGLVMAPTRELVQQIHSDIKKFAKVVGLSCVAVYGGSGVAQQISDLKRGTEIVVCTPGRMIDILCTSSGKITNLRRVTYLVMDEADRMFDMGFEPQITRIVQNTRPDRQTVLFSATFPRQVETLARKVLNKPIEIQVGGRSVVNKDIAQFVEVRPENDRFFRLLELLGEWSEKGKILIFVQSQEKCDDLFRKLLKHGHPCLSLHGAKDQTDRESTITDFKTNVCNLLIATSVAARGLDVKELELVINFDVPNHYEDYVHRVGRTGRAGRKGCAITFIGEEDARYAPDLVKALELSEQVVPDDLKALAEGFSTKVNQGLEKAHGTGYGGSGFKFNEEEDEVRRAAKKAQAKEYGFEEDKTDSDDEDDAVKKTNDITQPVSVPMQPVTSTSLLTNGLPLGPVDVATRAMMNLKHNLQKIQNETVPEHFEAELEINDFPQNARWKVTHKETLGPISEWTGAAITTRGQYFPPGKIPGPGERKLYLFIEGKSEQYVKKARAELKRVLEDITAQTSSLPGSAQPGRYSVFS